MRVTGQRHQLAPGFKHHLVYERCAKHTNTAMRSPKFDCNEKAGLKAILPAGVGRTIRKKRKAFLVRVEHSLNTNMKMD
jgi:hypothetical protein